jgi:hypothetical protein
VSLRREYIKQKVTVQCHGPFFRRFSYDGGRVRTSRRFLYAVSCLCCNADSLHSPAELLRSDLILIETWGRQGIIRFVLGSVSHAVLHKMPCPVLVFH